LVRGGGKVSDHEIVERTFALLGQGISGLVYGRNVIQHQSPRKITQAMLALLHEGATIDQALAILQ
jgi:DhnA family fructose-bisphosphate aldolase class Ia